MRKRSLRLTTSKCTLSSKKFNVKPAWFGLSSAQSERGSAQTVLLKTTSDRQAKSNINVKLGNLSQAVGKSTMKSHGTFLKRLPRRPFCVSGLIRLPLGTV